MRRLSHGPGAVLALTAVLAALPSSPMAADSAPEPAVERAVLGDELADFGRAHGDAMALAAAGRLARVSGRLTDVDDPYAPARIFADAKRSAGDDKTLAAFVLQAEADRDRHVTSARVSTHAAVFLKPGPKPLDIPLDCRPNETMIASVRQVADGGSMPSPVSPVGAYPLALSVKGPGAAAAITRNRETIQAVWTPPAGNASRYVVEVRNLSKTTIMVDFNAD